MDSTELIFQVLGVLFVTAIMCAVLGIGIKLATDDARRRGKSALLVSIACILFFPWGLVAWLVFRPDPIEDNREKFRLENHRVQ